MVSVGTVVFLSQELMFFAGLFAMYFVSRANGLKSGTWDYGPAHLNVPFALIVTIILVASSFTARWASLPLSVATSLVSGVGTSCQH